MTSAEAPRDPDVTNPRLEAGFMTWNRIRILTPRAATAATTAAGATGMLHM